MLQAAGRSRGVRRSGVRRSGRPVVSKSAIAEVVGGASRREIAMLASRALSERSLYGFVKQAWPVVDSVRFIDGWHIEQVCRHLEAVTRGEISDLVVNIPPGCCKSLLTCVFWPAWVWGPCRWPSARWLFSSYSQDLSTRDSVRCRALVESQWYQTLWPHVRLTDDQNQKTRYDTTVGGWRIATSVTGRGTGEHPDFVVADDPHNVRQAMSDVERRAALEWWDGTILTRGVIKRSRRVIVMQRLHPDDLSGHALRSGGAEHLCLAMEFEPERVCVTKLGLADQRTQPGELLWDRQPDGKRGPFTRQVVDRLKLRLGARAAGQLQQRPISRGGAMFRAADFRRYTVEHTGAGLVFILPRDDGSTYRVAATSCWWFQTCDTAQKVNQLNDYTVVGTFALTPEGDLIVVEIARQRIEVPQQYAYLVAQRLRWPLVAVQAVEDQASGIGLIQQGRANGTPFEPLKATSDKASRASTVATFYGAHKVYHPSGAAWIGDFEAELIEFPLVEHDDQVDVVAYAGRMAVEHAIKGVGVLEADEQDLPSMSEMFGDLIPGL